MVCNALLLASQLVSSFESGGGKSDGWSRPPASPRPSAGGPCNDGACRPRTSHHTGFAFEDLDLGCRQPDGVVSGPLEVDGRADADTVRLPLPLWQVLPALFLESRDG